MKLVIVSLVLLMTMVLFGDLEMLPRSKSGAGRLVREKITQRVGSEKREINNCIFGCIRCSNGFGGGWPADEANQVGIYLGKIGAIIK